jgi:type I restriction enzyme S subunit
MTQEKAPLGRFLKVVGGYAFKSENFSEHGIPIIRISDIRDGQISIDNAAKISADLAGRGLNYSVEAGDILIAMSGATTGKIGLAPANLDTLVLQNQRVGNFKITSPEKLDRDYLRHFVCSENYQKQVSSLMAGAAQPNISGGQLESIEIQLPLLHEQRRIAAILEQADALRAKRREALVQLDSLMQSIFIEMFGDPTTNPKGWQVVKLGSHTTKLSSGSTPTGGDAAYKEIGISLIRSLNVHDGKFVYKNLAHIDEQQAAKLVNVNVDANDVLLNITGASVARVCRAPADVLPARVNQHVMIIRPKPTINSAYLERLLLTPQMKRKLLQIGGAGATREAITKAQAEELPVICPPIELQSEFERRLLSLKGVQTNQADSLDTLDELFASLQHRAFQGEL